MEEDVFHECETHEEEIDDESKMIADESEVDASIKKSEKNIEEEEEVKEIVASKTNITASSDTKQNKRKFDGVKIKHLLLIS